MAQSQSKERKANGVLGKRAELAARRFLRTQGLHIVSSNFRCRFGEIDIIAQDNRTIVFVEVRYRKLGNFGNGADSIDGSKRAKILRTAGFYLQRRGGGNQPCRFDVIAMAPANDSVEFSIDWIRNAFSTNF